MALTPQGFEVDEEVTEDVVITESQPAPSKTWRLDFENGRIRGFIDNERAIRQYVRKALLTARNRFIIYDDQYGSELESLIGQQLTTALIETEIPRLVREAIVYDDRIDNVTNISVERMNDDVLVTLTVELVSGESITMTEGVTI